MNKNTAAAIVLAIVGAVLVLPSVKRATVAPAPDAPLSPDEKEAKDKLGRLAVKVTFERYDEDKSGKLDRPEVTIMLTDANIGNWLTRSTWVSSIFAVIDTDKDNLISWEELQAAFGKE